MFLAAILKCLNFSSKNLTSVVVLIFSLLFLLFTVILFIFFDRSYGSYQFVSIVYFGNKYFPFSHLSFGVDGLGLVFLLLTSLIVCLCVITSWKINLLYVSEYALLLFVLEVFMLLCFIVLDIFTFFVFFESLLIPMFLIIGIWGSVSRKVHASLLFVIFTLGGSIFLFFSLLLLYYDLGTFSFSLLSKLYLPYYKQLLLGLFLFLSFALKIPMVPFHLWLPEAHVEAPSVGSVILAGILLKLGGYGMLRIVYPCFSEAVFFFLPLINVLSVVGILYPSFVAIRQVDLKRIIAYSSISHMNLTVLGLFCSSVEGVVGGCYLMLAHGIVSSLFFFLIGMLYDRHSTRLYFYYGGLCKVMPLFSFYFLLASFCNIGLPGTCNFIGEILIFLGLILQNKLIFFFFFNDDYFFIHIYTFFI